MVKESKREDKVIAAHKGESVMVEPKLKEVESQKKGEESTSTASEVRAIDSYEVASGTRLTEVETGREGTAGAPETTSIQSEKAVQQENEEERKGRKGKAKRDILSITGKYTRIQPMSSIRRIEYFDVADDEGGTNKQKLSYEQVVANIEEGQIYSIVDSNGDSSRLKVVQTPRGKVITTEKDNSEVNNIHGAHIAEYPLDAETQTVMEAQEKSKKEKEKDKK